MCKLAGREPDPLVGCVYHKVRSAELIVRNVDSVDVRRTQDEVDHGLNGGKSEESSRGDQKDGVAQITGSMQEDVDANAEEHQVDTWAVD